ncbi:hypothetical protein OAV26_02405, partial [Crocinitomicaceae bacterium]|nr:hypothetical protein [Crocinitomicaceae bacterium]
GFVYVDMFYIISFILLVIGIGGSAQVLSWLEEKGIISRLTYAKAFTFFMLSFCIGAIYIVVSGLIFYAPTPVKNFFPVFMYYLGYTMVYGSILMMVYEFVIQMIADVAKTVEESKENKEIEVTDLLIYIVLILLGIFGMLIVSRFG